MAGGGDLHSEAGTAASPGRGTTSSSGSSKGVKKAISPANECRCKCVCVLVCVCVCTSPCLGLPVPCAWCLAEA